MVPSVTSSPVRRDRALVSRGLNGNPHIRSRSPVNALGEAAPARRGSTPGIDVDIDKLLVFLALLITLVIVMRVPA